MEDQASCLARAERDVVRTDIMLKIYLMDVELFVVLKELSRLIAQKQLGCMMARPKADFQKPHNRLSSLSP